MITNKRILNFLVIVLLSLITFAWTFWIFHEDFMLSSVMIVIVIRLIASALIFKDYSLSWSKATQKTFLIKSVVYFAAFAVYMPLFYSKLSFSFLVSELFIYLFCINLLMYGYYYYMNRGTVVKNKEVVIYGAGKAGLKLEEEFRDSNYRVRCFVDDSRILHRRSIDGVRIVSKEELKEKLKGAPVDLLVIAMPSAPVFRIREIYDRLHPYFSEIRVLPALDAILQDKPFARQLKDVSVEDLLARNPKDLDKEKISAFLKNKRILITGAGGSIGSEIVRQCAGFGARELILLDHSEYNLYRIEQEMHGRIELVCVMQSVVDREQLERTFRVYRPEIVIHAAAYKHVPLVEENVVEAIRNNIVGTKNCIDLAIEYGAKKFVLISTDKAVRPTNVMGATKRICELYAQNSNNRGTEIVGVRFGNVLGSSGSVIPKFRQQIAQGGPITVTDPEITRYFMLIPEACELVLQAGAIGNGGEIFILDMGEPIRIVDLAKHMIQLSGRDDIDITFTGLRPGEKLYEELLIDDSDMHTEHDSITVAAPTDYPLEELNADIEVLLASDEPLVQLKKMVPEFKHNRGR